MSVYLESSRINPFGRKSRTINKFLKHFKHSHSFNNVGTSSEALSVLHRPSQLPSPSLNKMRLCVGWRTSCIHNTASSFPSPDNSSLLPDRVSTVSLQCIGLVSQPPPNAANSTYQSGRTCKVSSQRPIFKSTMFLFSIAPSMQGPTASDLLPIIRSEKFCIDNFKNIFKPADDGKNFVLPNV